MAPHCVVLPAPGYAEAIQSQKLLNAIASGSHGAIALSYVEWAGEGEQMIVVDWAVIRNAADARAFAAALKRRAALFRGTHRNRLGDQFRLRPFQRGQVRRRSSGDRCPLRSCPRSWRKPGGRLPRGFCIKRLTDLPMLWSEQWRAIGLQAPAQVRAELG